MFVHYKRYARNLSGAIMVAFCLMGPIIIGAAGMALDFAHAYLVQQRLAQAIDSAALAAAASSTDPEEIEAKIRQFFETNYPPEKLGATFDPEVSVTDSEIHVSGHAYYITFFLNVIGIDNVNVNTDTTVHRVVRGLEVVLVLDNTGSMSTNDNIGALRDATESFINILFDRAQDPEDIKVGLVPYSNSVRLGKYGLGTDPDTGSAYADGDVFVTLPSGVSYTSSSSSSSSWYGCVVEHKATNYNSSATHVAGSKGQLWQVGSSNWKGHGWDPASSTNDPYPQDVTDDYGGPWDIYMYGKTIASGDKCSNYSGLSNSRCSSCTGSNSTCNKTYCYCWTAEPNAGCPRAYVMPLTSDQEALIARVDDMQPEGNTLGNVGMMWGYRMISPEPPFEEAAAWDNTYWRKAVIMMTDGDNTIDSGTTGYSYYGPGSKNDMTVTKLNNRYAEVCQKLKDEGVLVYTVTFYSNINAATKEFYRECATSPDQYYDAPTQEELIGVFEQISRELSQIYISG
jgi:Flp pilus assembly protein TadG